MGQHMKTFIKQQLIGLVSTCDGSTTHGVPIYYVYDDTQNCFYFLTKTASRKYSNLEKNNKASISIYSETPPVVYSADCVAELLEISDENCSEKFKQLVELHVSQKDSPTPISTMRGGLLVIVKLNIIDFDYKSYIQDISELKSGSTPI